jgi:putative oxidoreductase
MKLFETNENAVDGLLLFLRLALGAVMFAHGAQKVLGWFGGFGFNATMQAFTGMMHIPPFFALLAILAEFAGSILLIAGGLTRLSALAITINMFVAVAMVHAANGFFMNWTGQQKGEGFEYHILAIAIGVTLLVAGAGRYSIDALVARALERRAGGISERRLAA